MIRGEDKASAVLGGLDLYKLSLVRSVLIKTTPTEREGYRTDVTLEIEYTIPSAVLTIVLTDVRDLSLPPIGSLPPLTLSELQIEDIRDRGMENISYRVEDHGYHSLAGWCGDIRLTKVVYIAPHGEETVAWEEGE